MPTRAPLRCRSATSWAARRSARRRHGGRGRDAGAPLTDITAAPRRESYEKELKQRGARLAGLRKQLEPLEEEAIKKMPAEDQRASEGADRPRVLRKVPQFLSGQK